MTEPFVQIAPLHKELIDVLKAQGSVRGIQVLAGFVNAGEELARQADRESLVPAAILMLGSPGEDTRHAGITSSRADNKTFTFSVLVLADSDYMVSQAVDVVNSIFSGYIPEGCSEISVVASVGGSPVGTALNPLRYARTCGYYLTIEPTQVP